MSDKKNSASFSELYQKLITHMLKNDASSTQEERLQAFNNSGISEPLKTLIDKVANYSYKVTDHDIDAVKQSGVSEDQIFELIICAAAGQASRQYHQALTVLAEVDTHQEGVNHAS